MSFLSTRVPFVEVAEGQLVGGLLTKVLTQLSLLNYPQEMACEDGALQLVERLLEVK